MKAIEIKMWISVAFWWDDLKKAMNLNKSVSSWIQLILTDVALLIQNTAKIYAPYLTWNLRWSIWTDFNRIQQWIAVVWSDVSYARKREFENRAHPDRVLYLHRAWRDNEWNIQSIINKDLSKELK